MPTAAAYAASKWGVEALSKSTAQGLRELGLQNKVLSVPFSPGVVQTPMNRMPSSAPVDVWAPLAARYLLQITPDQSGSSLSMSDFGFYSQEYMATWQIPDGLPVSDVLVPPAPSRGCCGQRVGKHLLARR